MKFVAGTSAPQGAKHRTVANRRARVHAINTVSVYLRGKRSSHFRVCDTYTLLHWQLRKEQILVNIV